MCTTCGCQTGETKIESATAPTRPTRTTATLMDIPILTRTAARPIMRTSTSMCM